MPLIIGDLTARIELEEAAAPGEPPGRLPSALDEETRRLKALQSARFEAERRINQRDPERLGGD